MPELARSSVGRLLATALLAGLCNVSPAAADGSADGWQFSMTPYIWAPGINGDVAVRGRSSSVDASFADVVDKSDSIFGYFSQFELRKGRWAMFVAPSYMDITMDESATVGPLTLDADASTKLLFVDFGGAYRLFEWGQGVQRGTPSGGSFEIMAGGRYTYLNLEIDLTTGGLPPGFTGARSVEGSQSWVDPFFGAHTQLRLSERWVASLRGDVGGFGLGSDLALQGVAVIGYELEIFGRAATIFGGYRALYQDFDEGSGTGRFEWDVTLHGPMLGLSVIF